MAERTQKQKPAPTRTEETVADAPVAFADDCVGPAAKAAVLTADDPAAVVRLIRAALANPDREAA